MRIIIQLLLLTIFYLNTCLLWGQNEKTDRVVIAECNPFNNYSQNMTYLKGMNYENLNRNASSISNGKLRTYIPLITQVSYPLSLKEAVLYEIETAQKYGINTFRFPYYISTNNNYHQAFKRVMDAYFEVAQEKNLDFKFAIELVLKRNKKVPSIGYLHLLEEKIEQLYAEKGNHRKWLRDDKGNILLFVKNPEQVFPTFHIDRKLKNTKELSYNIPKIRELYNSILDYKEATFTIAYHNNFIKDIQFTKRLSKYFPTMYYPPFKQFREEEMNKIATYCKENQLPFIQPVYAQYFSSKLRWKSNSKYVGKTNDDNLLLEEVYINADLNNFSQKLITTLDQAIKRDADMIDITSWNNFDQGTSIAPEYHHQFSFGEILKYKLSIWKGNKPLVMEQCIINQYANDFSTNIEIGRVNFRNREEEFENVLEIITLLNESAEVYLDGKYKQ